MNSFKRNWWILNFFFLFFFFISCRLVRWQLMDCQFQPTWRPMLPLCWRHCPYPIRMQKEKGERSHGRKPKIRNSWKEPRETSHLLFKVLHQLFVAFWFLTSYQATTFLCYSLAFLFLWISPVFCLFTSRVSYCSDLQSSIISTLSIRNKWPKKWKQIKWIIL